MNNGPIAFYDSGIGGLPYLAWVRERLPEESFVYVGDNENFPYGEKGHDALSSIAVSVVQRIIDSFTPKLVVVACNTASVVALAELRRRFTLPFVGVVPAVKPAAERSRHRTFALLATTRTVSDVYSENLINEYASDCKVVRMAGQELVSFVENELLDADPAALDRAMEAAIEPIRCQPIDSLILGCTHFTFLDRELKRRLGDGVELIDSREGVGNQVLRLLAELGLERNGGPSGVDARLFHTAPDGGRYRRFAERFGLGYGGLLP